MFKGKIYNKLPLLLGVALLLICQPEFTIASETVEDIADGKYLTAAGGCQACHTDVKNGELPFAGGRPLKTPFGIFYTPNITSDKKNGIGSWSETDFLNAVKKGISPSGSHYFPAFPYTSYTKMKAADALSIFAYLKSLPAVSKDNRPHDVSAPFSWRWLQWGWKLLFFSEGNYIAPANASEEIARGGYLVEALGHCSECHTPRNLLGGMKNDLYMAGAAGGGEGELVSNITPDPGTGIGEWTKGDIVSFLETGMKPDFDDVQGSMEEVITHGTSKLSKKDRTAMAVYLLSLKPITHKVQKSK